MSWIEALLLGLLQGLTEFLPVSSSGHLELGKALMGIQVKDSLVFTVVVHGATVMSTIVIFYKEIFSLIKGFFRFRWNDETQYLTKIAISLIPIAIVGLFFKDQVETLFDGNLVFVGAMLLLT
ncbi:MAG: undecaprenyl-diphosphate phosphatase, partial [Bacteroidales bacterium]|nr:undecaprenyl-diphosphate phosphatase [Bacteroidales bacterium]